ncbi:MAG TPA: hypothetical protein VJZ71_17805 [Phycisphaerae bacterium]|nr:hypothetical protein [Phycisphaerae bacterium]
MSYKTMNFKPAQRVRVRQRIRSSGGPWDTEVEGTVVSCAPQPTGSWYAHGKNDRLWLQRLRLRRSDGEIVDLVLDNDSSVTVL